MPGTLNKKAYEQLFDENIEWLLNQTRSLERDHIIDCMRWMRDHKYQCDCKQVCKGKKKELRGDIKL